VQILLIGFSSNYIPLLSHKHKLAMLLKGFLCSAIWWQSALSLISFQILGLMDKSNGKIHEDAL
jgi:hypothetical protein